MILDFDHQYGIAATRLGEFAVVSLGAANCRAAGRRLFGIQEGVLVTSDSILEPKQGELQKEAFMSSHGRSGIGSEPEGGPTGSGRRRKSGSGNKAGDATGSGKKIGTGSGNGRGRRERRTTRRTRSGSCIARLNPGRVSLLCSSTHLGCHIDWRRRPQEFS